MTRRILLLSAVALIASGVPALAELRLAELDAPTEGNSWYQRFTITDTGTDSEGDTDTFDKMVIQHKAGVEFEPPGIDNFNPPSPFTSITYTPDQRIEAVGDDIGTLEFDLHFQGDITDPVWFHLAVYDVVYTGGVPSDEVGVGLMAYWDGTDWVLGIGDSGLFEPLGAPVPVPAAALLGMLGMAGAGWGLRRMC